MPYREEVISEIKSFKSKGYKVILASASPDVWVKKIGQHLGLFEISFGSTNKNLKGWSKYLAIKDLIGSDEFLYLGDSKSDFEIWKSCKSAITVNVSKGAKLDLESSKVQIIKSIDDRKLDLKTFAKQIRVHQWSKNLLIFLPSFAAHKISLESFYLIGVAFITFSFAASSVYLANDLIDVDSDRKHHYKKNRPIASGAFSFRNAILSILILLVAAISLLGYFQLWSTLSFILFYLGLNFLYSFYLKKEILLDIVILSSMYTLRIFVGGAAASIWISTWLLSFSTLFFFSLACVKRYTELIKGKTKISVEGRGYRNIDQSAVQILGISSGLLSVVIAQLYIQSESTRLLYAHPQRLWILTPILLYWVGRLWILTTRAEVHDDPVIWAFKDKKSWIAAGFVLVTLFGAAFV